MKRSLTLALLLGASLRAAAAPPDPATTAARVDDYLSRLAGYGFSGAVVVGRGDDVILEKGYGLADREAKVPFGKDTVVNTGSITKQFTAAAILKLEMEGKLATSDSIARFFPQTPADKKAITLHHLLTHTAGLREDYGPSDAEKVTRDEIVRRILTEKAPFSPGERFRYSNAGYSLLAAIVEVVTGGSYESYLRKALFLPAGMTQTGYTLPAWPANAVAIGYRDGERWGTIPGRQFGPDGPYWNLRGNGGLQTTVGDMWRWHRALLGTAILSATAKEKLMRPWVEEEGGDSFYGYGWSVAKTPRKTTVVMHNGGNGVFAADCRRYLDEGVFWFIASNSSDAPAIPVSSRIAGLMFGMDFPIPPRPVTLDASALAARAGTYKLPSGAPITATVDAGRLAFTTADPEALSFLLGGGTLDAERAATLRTRSVELVTESQKGNVAPLHKAFGGMPLEQIRAREAEMWTEFRAEHGDFKSAVALATFPAREQALAVLVRLDGTKGPAYRQFMWEDGRLRGIRPLLAPPSARFTPVEGGAFAALDFGSGQVASLRFDGDALVLPGKDGDIRAKR